MARESSEIMKVVKLGSNMKVVKLGSYMNNYQKSTLGGPRKKQFVFQSYFFMYIT